MIPTSITESAFFHSPSTQTRTLHLVPGLGKDHIHNNRYYIYPYVLIALSLYLAYVTYSKIHRWRSANHKINKISAGMKVVDIKKYNYYVEKEVIASLPGSTITIPITMFWSGSNQDLCLKIDHWDDESLTAEPQIAGPTRLSRGGNGWMYLVICKLKEDKRSTKIMVSTTASDGLQVEENPQNKVEEHKMEDMVAYRAPSEKIKELELTLQFPKNNTPVAILTSTGKDGFEIVQTQKPVQNPTLHSEETTIKYIIKHPIPGNNYKLRWFWNNETRHIAKTHYIKKTMPQNGSAFPITRESVTDVAKKVATAIAGSAATLERAQLKKETQPEKAEKPKRPRVPKS